ncbi:MAG: LacI family DNA-binding transcriptional regulator [Pseudomonadota bacterium]
MASDTKTRPRTRPSIRDVARKAGVSPGCVSNVMNGRRRQDDLIGRAVLEAVDALGYRRNTIASNLRRTESRIVGLVIPEFENPFFAGLVAQLERVAKTTNYRIVATSSGDDAETEAREIDELVGWRVAGLLLVPALGSRAEILAQGIDTPFVLIDRLLPGSGIDSVGVDNAAACQTGMGSLIAAGHRKILVAYLGEGIANVDERLAGVRLAAEQAGPEICVDYLATGSRVPDARAAMDAYLSTHEKPDAIFCLFNVATLAAYGALQERGAHPGHDTALLSFDDSAWMAQMHPPVAAISQPVAEIASRAWAQLIARVEGADCSAGAMIRVPCQLAPRGTMEADRHRPTT